MIGSLRGALLDRSPRGEVLVEVCGVGYRVLVPTGTLADIGGVGTEIVLHTHLHVREDALILYGFATRDERACFEALLGAHGVGPALALAILSVHSPDTLRRALAEDDADALTMVPGVGKKTAARLLIELQSRLDLEPVEASMVGTGSAGPGRAEVRAALAELGYEDSEVRAVLRELPADGDVEPLLREALRLLAAAR